MRRCERERLRVGGYVQLGDGARGAADRVAASLGVCVCVGIGLGLGRVWAAAAAARPDLQISAPQAPQARRPLAAQSHVSAPRGGARVRRSGAGPMHLGRVGAVRRQGVSSAGASGPLARACAAWLRRWLVHRMAFASDRLMRLGGCPGEDGRANPVRARGPAPGNGPLRTGVLPPSVPQSMSARLSPLL